MGINDKLNQIQDILSTKQKQVSDSDIFAQNLTNELYAPVEEQIKQQLAMQSAYKNQQRLILEMKKQDLEQDVNPYAVPDLTDYTAESMLKRGFGVNQSLNLINKAIENKNKYEDYERKRALGLEQIGLSQMGLELQEYEQNNRTKAALAKQAAEKANFANRLSDQIAYEKMNEASQGFADSLIGQGDPHSFGILNNAEAGAYGLGGSLAKVGAGAAKFIGDVAETGGRILASPFDEELYKSLDQDAKDRKIIRGLNYIQDAWNKSKENDELNVIAKGLNYLGNIGYEAKQNKNATSLNTLDDLKHAKGFWNTLNVLGGMVGEGILNAENALMIGSTLVGQPYIGAGLLAAGKSGEMALDARMNDPKVQKDAYKSMLAFEEMAKTAVPAMAYAGLSAIEISALFKGMTNSVIPSNTLTALKSNPIEAFKYFTHQLPKEQMNDIAINGFKNITTKATNSILTSATKGLGSMTGRATLGASIEGSTEYAQTMLEQLGGSHKAISDLTNKDWSDMHKQALEAGIVGSIVGGTIGGTTSITAPIANMYQRGKETYNKNKITALQQEADKASAGAIDTIIKGLDTDNTPLTKENIVNNAKVFDELRFKENLTEDEEKAFFKSLSILYKSNNPVITDVLNSSYNFLRAELNNTSLDELLSNTKEKAIYEKIYPKVKSIILSDVNQIWKQANKDIQTLNSPDNEITDNQRVITNLTKLSQLIDSADLRYYAQDKKDIVKSFISQAQNILKNEDKGVKSDILIYGNSKNGKKSLLDYYNILLNENSTDKQLNDAYQEISKFETSQINKKKILDFLYDTDTKSKANILYGINKLDPNAKIQEFGDRNMKEEIQSINPNTHLFYRSINSDTDESIDNKTKAVRNALNDEIKHIQNIRTKYQAKTKKEQQSKQRIQTETKENYVREQVAEDNNNAYLFGDNLNDKYNTKYIPLQTQAVIRGLPNAFGIVTKKDRKTNINSYLTDQNFDEIKNDIDKTLDEAIDYAKKHNGKIIIPSHGIGTGKADLKNKAPKIFEYINHKLVQLQNQENKIDNAKIDELNNKQIELDSAPDIASFQEKIKSNLQTDTNKLNTIQDSYKELNNELDKVQTNKELKALQAKASFAVKLFDKAKDFVPENIRKKFIELKDISRKALAQKFIATKVFQNILATNDKTIDENNNKGLHLKDVLQLKKNNFNKLVIGDDTSSFAGIRKIKEALNEIVDNTFFGKLDHALLNKTANKLKIDADGEIIYSADRSRKMPSGDTVQYTNNAASMLNSPYVRASMILNSIESVLDSSINISQDLEDIREGIAKTFGIDSFDIPNSIVYKFKNSVFAQNFQEELGSNILKDLGIMFKEDIISEEEASLIKQELGVYALNALRALNIIELHRVPRKEIFPDTKDNSSILIYKKGKDFDLISNKNNEHTTYSILNGIRDFLQIKNDKKITYSTKPFKNDYKSGDKLYIQGLGEVPINENMAKALNTHNSTEYVLTNVNDIIDNFEDPSFIRNLKKILGYKELDKVLPYERDAQESLNDQIQKDIDNVLEYIKNLKHQVDNINENQENKLSYSEYANKHPIYFPFTYMSNGRHQNMSRTINPQTSKLHRFLFIPKEQVNLTYDIKNNEVTDEAFYISLAQAFGFATDKEHTDDSIEIGKELSKLHTEDLYDAINKGKITINDKSIEIEHPSHALTAMYAIDKFQEAIKDHKTHFKATLMSESDAITNGIILKELQYMQDYGKSLENIKLGGVDINEIPNKINNRFATGQMDSYQRTANELRKEVEDISNPDIYANYLKEELALDERGKVTSKARKLVKPILMVFGYGAGIKSIGSHFINSILDNIPKTLLSTEVKDKTKQDLLFKMISDITKKSKEELLHYIKTNDNHLMDMPLNETGFKTLGKFLEYKFADVFDLHNKSKETKLFKILNNLYPGMTNVNEIVNKIMNEALKAFNQKYLDYRQQIIKEKGKFTLADKKYFYIENNQNMPGITRAGNLNNETINLPMLVIGKSRDLAKNNAITLDTINPNTNAKEGRTISPIINNRRDRKSVTNVFYIHQLDGTIMADLLAWAKEKGYSVTDVHDALVLDAKHAEEINQKMNELSLKYSKQYSMLEQIQKVAKNLNNKELIETIEPIVEISKRNRQKLFEQQISYDNVNNGFRNSAYIQKAKQQEKIQAKSDTQILAESLSKLSETLLNRDKPKEELLPDITNVKEQKLKEYWEDIIKTNPKASFEAFQKDIQNLKLLDFRTKEFKNLVKAYSTPDLFNNLNNMKLDQNELKEVLSSQDNESSQEINQETLADKFNGDPKVAYKIFDKLKDLDIKQGYIDIEHSETLKNVLDKFIANTKAFLPEINIKLSQIAKEHNEGDFNLETKTLSIRAGENVSPAKTSLQETYVHELIHAVTGFAFKFPDKIRRQIAGLKELHQRVIEVIDIEDLLPEVSTGNIKLDREIAQRTYDHIFKNKNLNIQLQEFMAIGLTNKNVINKLKTSKLTTKSIKENMSLFDKLMAFLDDLTTNILSWVSTGIKGNNQNIYEALVSMTYNIAKVNNLADNVIEERAKNIHSMFSSLLDKADEKLHSTAMGALYTFFDTTNPIREKINKQTSKDAITATLKGVNTITNAAQMLFDDRIAKGVDKVSQKVQGTLNETLNSLLDDFSTPDKIERALQHLQALSSRIDSLRNANEQTIENTLRNEFKDISKEQAQQLGVGLLDTDLYSLLDHYSLNKIKELLNDKEQLVTEITHFEKQISDLAKKDKIISKEVPVMEYMNWIKFQTDGLAEYMMTNKVFQSAQLLNAHNIANMYISSHKINGASKEIIDSIDKLITLKALQKISPRVTDTILTLLDTNPEAMTEVLTAIGTHSKLSNEKLFKDSPFNKLKGYRAEVMPNNMEIRIADSNEKEQLLSSGWKIVKEDLDKNKQDTFSKRRSIFIRDFFVVPQKWNRTTVRLTDNSHKGSSMYDLYREDFAEGNTDSLEKFEESIVALRKNHKFIADSMFKGKNDYNEKQTAMLPIVNSEGSAHDFRYVMNKDFKINILKSDTDIFKAIAREYATTQDKILTLSHNEKVAKIIVEDSLKNSSKEPLAYIELKQDSEDQRIKDIWMRLPNAFKKLLEESFDEKPILIRKDLITKYFGFKDKNIENAKWYKNNKNKIVKLATLIAVALAHKTASLAKQSMVIKSLSTLTGNLVSNISQSVIYGLSLKETLQYQMEAAIALNQYRSLYNKKLSLEQLQRAGKKINVNELKAIDQKLLNSPIAPLMQAGLYDAIIEDLDKDEISQDKVDEIWSKTKKKLPSFIQKGLDIAFVSEKTRLFHLLFKFTQAGDFVARYAMFKHNEKKGMKLEDNLNIIRDQFIDYNLPTSATIKMLNDYGFAFFTKYKTRLPRALKALTTEHPARATLGLIAALLAPKIDISDPYESSIFVQGLDRVFDIPLLGTSEYLATNLPILNATGLSRLL
jgi:hypothetical protein